MRNPCTLCPLRSYPEMVPKILPFCGSARTAEHNKVAQLLSLQTACSGTLARRQPSQVSHVGFEQVFIDGVRSALTADAKFMGGWYNPDDPPVIGLRAAGRVYAGWGLSQPWYRDEVLGHVLPAAQH